MAVFKKKDSNSKNSRVIIVVCVLILILIPFVTWLLGHKNIATSTAPISELTTYKANGITFSYPKDWKESSSGVPEGVGIVYYLQPSSVNSTSMPHIIVKITPATKSEVARTNLSYKLLNYKKSDATVDGVGGQKYTQVLQSVHGPFHSVSYVFQKKKNLYLIELGYTQANKDPQLENEFTQIVNNFSTN
jgi:photosystem II reaction center protein PsbP